MSVVPSPVKVEKRSTETLYYFHTREDARAFHLSGPQAWKEFKEWMVSASVENPGLFYIWYEN